MITHFIKIGKSIYEHFPRPTISVDLDGKVTFGLDTSAVFTTKNTDAKTNIPPTRVGLDPSQSEAFYESRRDKIWSFYFQYKNTHAHDHNLLYAEMIYLCSSKKPLKFHGLGATPSEVSKIKINLLAAPYVTPDVISERKDIAVNFFKRCGKIIKRTDEYENNDSLRVESISNDSSGNIILNCSKAKYFDQVGTNLIMDWKINEDNITTTLREIESNACERGLLPPLHLSKLANTIGVAVLLFDSEGNPLLRIRSKNLASINEGKLHCSASGVLEYPSGTEPGKHSFSLLNYGMIKEIKDEIGLDSSEYDLYPVAFARELPRGGKPQIFFAAKTKLSIDEINDRINNANERHEYSSSGIDLNHWYIASRNKEHYTYEGWACLYLAMQFARANNWIKF